MSVDGPAGLADQIRRAVERHEIMPSPSATVPGFDLSAAYAVEAELMRARVAGGHRAVGRKVGYANRAVWRALKLETLVWAHMYDDSVRFAEDNAATLPVARFFAPKIEPEIVVKLRREVTGEPGDAVGALEAVEWIALGFEIIDCVYPDWKFQPADFVAGYGLHAALVVGTPRIVEAAAIPSLVEQLASFKVTLSKNGTVVAEGVGRNSLRSPALCVAELAAATARRTDTTPLAAGEIISTGTLTESQPIAAGETWIATVDGIELPPLTLAIG